MSFLSPNQSSKGNKRNWLQPRKSPTGCRCQSETSNAKVVSCALKTTNITARLNITDVTERQNEQKNTTLPHWSQQRNIIIMHVGKTLYEHIKPNVNMQMEHSIKQYLFYSLKCKSYFLTLSNSYILSYIFMMLIYNNTLAFAAIWLLRITFSRHTKGHICGTFSLWWLNPICLLFATHWLGQCCISFTA